MMHKINTLMTLVNGHATDWANFDDVKPWSACCSSMNLLKSNSI